MEVNKLLNPKSSNKNSKISEDDIDDFLKRANEVERIISGMKDNTINPDDTTIDKLINIDDISTTIKYESVYKPTTKDVILNDKEKWWRDVDILYPLNIQTDNSNNESIPSKTLITDYNKWNSWTPDDPVTKQEEEEKKVLEDKKANEEFEKNNPEFCKQFIDDNQSRVNARNEKISKADKCRIEGNKYYSKKLYKEALKQYSLAYELFPFDDKILNNISQVYIKQDKHDEASEFLNRVLRIDPINIKALSRKATILQKRNDFYESIKLIDNALTIDSNNKDLIIQRNDLVQIIKELEIEKRSLSDHVSTNNIYFTLLDKFKNLLTSSKIDSVEDLISIYNNSQLDITIPNDKDSSFTLINKIISNDIKYKYYLINHNIHQIIINILTTFISKGDINIIIINSEKFINIFMQLSILINSNRKSKKYLLESNLLDQIIKSNIIFKLLDNNSNNHYIEGLLVLNSLCNVYLNCLSDASYQKLSDSILTDIKHLQSISYIALYTTCNINEAEYDLYLNIYFVINQIVYNFIIFISIDESLSLSAYPVIIKSLNFILNAVCNLSVDIRLNSHDLIEKTLDIITKSFSKLSQDKSIHVLFTNKFNFNGHSINTIDVMIKSCKIFSNYLSSFIGILTNISIDTKNSVREIIYDNGAVDLIQNILSSNSSQLDIPLDSSISLGLLSRLTSIKLVQSTVTSTNILSTLCYILKKDTNNTDRVQDVWINRRINYITHILAEVEFNKNCYEISFATNIHKSLLDLFPEPNCDIDGKVTSATVCLTPKSIQDTVILGNAARCLIKCSDYSNLSSEIFSLQSQGPDNGIARMICAMATCSDVRVRKNIAILLAKGCKLSNDVRQRVSDLRGMQIMIEITK